MHEQALVQGLTLGPNTDVNLTLQNISITIRIGVSYRNDTYFGYFYTISKRY
jgi:outer membrane scaffolding protein for murein synthesis (MipA/OmpV family)